MNRVDRYNDTVRERGTRWEREREREGEGRGQCQRQPELKAQNPLSLTLPQRSLSLSH